MRIVVLVVVRLLFLAPFANAQTTAGTMREFRLFGTWAGDCYRPASPANEFSIFSVSARGAVELQNDFGPSYGDMVYRIVDVKRIGQFRLSLRQLLTTDERIVLDTVMLRAADRIRTWSSRFVDGSTLVEDGSVPTTNGQETGWKSRCDERRADRRLAVPRRLGQPQPPARVVER